MLGGGGGKVVASQEVIGCCFSVTPVYLPIEIGQASFERCRIAVLSCPSSPPVTHHVQRLQVTCFPQIQLLIRKSLLRMIETLSPEAGWASQSQSLIFFVAKHDYRKGEGFDLRDISLGSPLDCIPPQASLLVNDGIFRRVSCKCRMPSRRETHNTGQKVGLR